MDEPIKPIIPDLPALIATWRERATNKPHYRLDGYMCIALAECADELEAALAVLPQPKMPADLVEANAVLEAVYAVAMGEPVSDFVESFPVVRAVMDLKAAAVLPEANDDKVAR